MSFSLDERTRMEEQRLATYESAWMRGFEEGFEKGFQEGIRRGRVLVANEMINKGYLTKNDAAKNLNISIEELEKYIKEYEQMII